MCLTLISTQQSGQQTDSLPELTMLSLDGQPLRTRVLESRHGKTLTVSFIFFIMFNNSKKIPMITGHLSVKKKVEPYKQKHILLK